MLIDRPDHLPFHCGDCGKVIVSDEYGKRYTYCTHYPYKPGLQAERLNLALCRVHMKPHESMESICADDARH